MDLNRHCAWVYGCLLLAWTLLLGWQTAEHFRVERAARTALIERAKDISTTVGIVLRAQRRFSGVISKERLESALVDLVKPDDDLYGLALLNATGSVVVSAGSLTGFDSAFGKRPSVRWDARTVTVMNLVDLGTNATHDLEPPAPPIVLSREERYRPSETNRLAPRRPVAPALESLTNTAGAVLTSPERTNPRDSRGEPHPPRPPWMSEADYKTMLQKQGVHSFLIVLSTRAVQAAGQQDFWLRCFIVFLGAVAVVGSGLAWRNLGKSAELQLRLVRASELTSHAKEMNLAAAGLAHETRNPLNIIRGMAQMISKLPGTPVEICEKTRAIVDEADKVAVQLNEFINYSRPREVHRSAITLQPAIKEVVQTLGYDIEEKNVHVEVLGEPVSIEADEQLLRQALFNLLLNAIQAANRDGHIQVLAGRNSASEGFLEIRDDGPGVPVEHRQEIFKPYFTTQRSGTGLGLAVVQQIVLAHSWDIACLPNEPNGAIFRIAHMKPAAKK